MRFIRENLFFVVLIGATVVLGAVAVAYYLGSDLNERLEKRMGLSRQLRGLVREPIKVSEKTVQDQQKRIAALGAASKNDVDGAVAFNRQNLRLVQIKTPSSAIPIDAFPIDEKRYSDEGLYFVFVQEYTKRLDALLAVPELRRTRQATRDEIRLEQVRLQETYKQDARAKAVELMKVSQATKGLVFIEADALDRVFERGQTRATPEQVWQGQVNLWVTQEIFQAVATTNAEVVAERVQAGMDANSASVLSSAVKRLVKVNITEPFITSMSGSGATAVLGQRISTDEYGLIRYRFSVIMPSRHIDRLLRVLMTQNYHAVLNVQISSAPADKTFYYGPEPSVLVGVDAEMLLLQRWIRPLLPPKVGDTLPAPPAMLGGQGT